VGAEQRREGSAGPCRSTDGCDMWPSPTMVHKPLNLSGRRESIRAAVGVDTHLFLVRGFLLFYIHTISVQLAKAGLRHRL